MNANELADELLYRYADEGGNFYGDDIHKDVIEVLRQQQAEIEALKERLEFWIKIADKERIRADRYEQ